MYDFWWDDWNIEHIARHGVLWYEAEEVLKNRPFTTKSRQGKFVALGQTIEGRYLAVVYARRPNQGIYVVTARDMSQRERRSYQRRRK